MTLIIVISYKFFSRKIFYFLFELYSHVQYYDKSEQATIDSVDIIYCILNYMILNY